MHDTTAYEERRLKANLRRINELLPENQKLFKDYTLYLKDELLDRPQTIITWQNRIFYFNKVLQEPLANVTKEHAEKLLAAISKDYGERSGAKVKGDYKKLRKWITGNETEPADVAWINGKRLYDSRKAKEKTPEDLPTEEEKDKLLAACMNSRDKALIMLLRETGIRPKELLSLDKRHLSFNQTEDVNMLTIPSDTKTGYRYVPFQVAKPYLLEWLAVHPQRDQENFPLWIQLFRNQGQRLTYKGLEGIFGLLKKRSGLENRKITPYSFRFASISEKAKQGWSDQELKAYHGHKPDSKMLNVYVQMSGRDLAQRIKGGKSKAKEPDVWIVKCPKCGHENTNKEELCLKCGQVVSLAKAQQLVQSQEDRLTEIEEFMGILKDSGFNLDRLKKLVS